MQFTSIWPYFLCMAALFGLAATPWFASIDLPPTRRGGRVSNLDGMRGFLAFAVFFHHAAITHRYLRDGEWTQPPSDFYGSIGQIGVGLFFIITGYLFWGRLIDQRGRPDWLALYVGRVFRIGPLYLAAIAIMLLIVVVRSGFQLNAPARDLFGQILQWAMLGYFGNGADVNGVFQTHLIGAGVFWSLGFEWRFYLSLIVIALATRNSRTHLPFALCALFASLVYLLANPEPSGLATPPICVALFASGMACASLERHGLTPVVSRTFGSIMVCGFLALIPLTSSTAYSVRPVLALGIAFLLIVSGADLFGLLSSRAARRLGDVSYGVYLLQGLALTLFFAFGPARGLALASPALYWVVTLACAITLLAVSAWAHVRIERVGVEAGRRFAAALGPWVSGKPPAGPGDEAARAAPPMEAA